MKRLLFVLVASLACLLTACEEKRGDSGTASAAATTHAAASAKVTKSYQVHGVVKKLEPAEKTVTIAHEAIPHYMEAMTMPFHVKNPNELEGLAPGDSVSFRLSVAADESWIDQVQKVDSSGAVTNAPAEREPFRIARDVEPLKVGDPMPDYGLTNELGKAIHLSDFQGQALAFTFIYTRCPLPDFCPRMSKNFLEVYQKLTAMPNAPTNWHLLTISFDPHHDTPAVLRSYAQAYQYNPQHWSFVTGAMIDIDAITDQFNLTIMKQGNQWDHKVRTVVVDAAGRIQQIIYGNTWSPDALVQEIIKAAAVKGDTPGDSAQK